MPARKTARKAKAAGGAKRRAPREAIDATLASLERELPPNFARAVAQLRARLRGLEKQLDRARSESERRWVKQQRQVRGELVRLLQRLERAVAPSGRKPARAKPAAKAAAKPASPAKPKVPAVPAPSNPLPPKS